MGRNGEKKHRTQLLDRRMTSNEIDLRKNAPVAPLSRQLEALIQSVKELTERSFIRSAEGNGLSEQSRSLGLRSDTFQDPFQ